MQTTGLNMSRAANRSDPYRPQRFGMNAYPSERSDKVLSGARSRGIAELLRPFRFIAVLSEAVAECAF
jgi:hypothetical protein